MCLWLTKNIGWGIICNWSVLEILAKIDIFCHRIRRILMNEKPKWYIARLFQLKFQMDEDFTCQILYTLCYCKIHIFHSDHLSVSELFSLYLKPNQKCVLIFTFSFLGLYNWFSLFLEYKDDKVRLKISFY